MIKGLFIITAFITASKATASPSLLPHAKCSLQNSTCLTEQARLVLKDFVDRIPSIGNEKLDKLSIDHFEIKRDEFNFEGKNIEVEGLKNTVIDTVSIDMDLRILQLTFRSTITLTMDYSADGKMFTFPVNGSGRAKATHRDVDIEMLILFDIIKKNDKDVMILKTYRFGFDTAGDTHLELNNIINDDKARSVKINSVLNKYWRTVTTAFGYDPIKAVLDKSFDAINMYLSYFNLEDIATY